MPSVGLSTVEMATRSPVCKPSRTYIEAVVSRRMSMVRKRRRLSSSTSMTWSRPRSAARGMTASRPNRRPSISASTYMPTASGGRFGSGPELYGSMTSATTCTMRLTGSISLSVRTMRPSQAWVAPAKVVRTVTRGPSRAALPLYDSGRSR